MSVLLVTDDSDDDIQIPNHDHLYQQIKELEYNYSSFESSLSIVRKKKSSHRQRRYRPQQCLVKTLFTYMLTLLFLTNHLHWSIIFFSFSSIKFMSTYASTTTTTRSSLQPSSSLSPLIKDDEQLCSPINTRYIDRICSKTCRARMTPFETLDNMDQAFFSSYYLPFCSNHTLNLSINQTDFDNSFDENKCRQIFEKIIALDEEAQKAYDLFVTYLKAIDSASNENRYSIITNADCQHAYRTWTCSVNIPYFHQNHRIPPCQTICDEVERACPTFRPSDREPLFAGQPLFFCNGGIVTNSNYGHRPHCFDTCHLTNGSFQRHSVSSPSSKKSSVTNLVEINVTTPLCFEIHPLIPSTTEQDSSSSSLSIDDSISNYTKNASMSASALSIISSAYSSILVNILTFIFVLLLKILQEYSS